MVCCYPGQGSELGQTRLGRAHLTSSLDNLLGACEDVKEEGLWSIVAVHTKGGTLDSVATGYERVLWRSLIRYAFDTHPEMTRFDGLMQEEARSRFRELDREILELNCQQLRAELSALRGSPGVASGPRSDWTENALLEYHANLQRPRIPIRKLIAGARAALQVIKPCWMMSPGSIAQFLRPVVEFDLLVIDEASQMKPEDAIAAVGRCRQMVVVGDPMQLPPTSFFDRTDEPDEDDDEDVEAESVLDLALSVYQLDFPGKSGGLLI